MKALLICPDERSNVPALAEKNPLALVSVLGKPLICYWLEHLANAGAKEIIILAADRPERIRAYVEDGNPWGIKAEVLPQPREFTLDEAKERFCAAGEWLQAPNNVAVVEVFPDLRDELLFESYDRFMAAILRKLPTAATNDRIGVREIKPGVFACLHAVISTTAELHAPCWIGENVRIGPRAVIGPNTVLEKNVLIEEAATITRSQIAPETFVGPFLEVNGSIAQEDILTNCQTGSSVRVADAFLLSGMAEHTADTKAPGVLAKALATLALVATTPIAAVFMLRSYVRGQRPFRVKRATQPNCANPYHNQIIYYELNNAPGFWKRWPQLLNIGLGDFSWVGNRPLQPMDASRLQTEFEKMWLACPIGLFSHADVESGNGDELTEENKAHSSFYAAQSSLKLNWLILRKAIKMCFRWDLGESTIQVGEPKPSEIALGSTVIR